MEQNGEEKQANDEKLRTPQLAHHIGMVYRYTVNIHFLFLISSTS